MKNLSISAKLIVGFLIVLILMISSIAISMYNIKSMVDQTQAYSQYTVPNITSTMKIRNSLLTAQVNILRAIQVMGTGGVGEDLSRMDMAEFFEKEVYTELDTFAANQRDDSLSEKIDLMRSALERTSKAREMVKKQIQNGDSYQAYQVFSSQYVINYDTVSAYANELSDYEAQIAEEQAIAVEKSQWFAWITMLAAAGISVVFSIIIIMILRRSILRPIKIIASAYEKISKGDLQTEIKYESRDEMGKMAKLMQDAIETQSLIIADIIDKFTRISQGDMRITVDLDYPGDYAVIKETIETTVDTLNNTLQIINTAAEQVSNGSDQVSSGAQSLAAGSSEQASAIEQLGVSVATIAEQAMENSAIVKTATQHVNRAGESVRDGNDHMKKLTEAMNEISHSSSQISSITKVIEDIAFQTNILALNAAIEAARAGAAGKGFAVVADEVRNLAAKSAEAAKQTAEIIERSAATISDGSQISEDTAQILQSVEEITQIISESILKIEEASSDQVAAIEQIKQGLSQVSAVVQTNAATAEQNSATSEEMAAQASTLREEINKFKLRDLEYEEDNTTAVAVVEDEDIHDAEMVDFDDPMSLGKY